MFRKDFKPSKQSRVKASDVKRLRADLQRCFSVERGYGGLTDEALDALGIAKGRDVQVCKHSAHCSYYTVDGLPLFFDPSDRKDYFPTLFTLYQLPSLLPTLFIHEPVSKFILNHADPMLPGVPKIMCEGVEGSLLGTLRLQKRSVKVLGNPTPFAVGSMEVSTSQIESEGMKGKALKVVHLYRDAMYEVGQQNSSEFSEPPQGFSPTIIRAYLSPEEIFGRDIYTDEEEERKGDSDTGEGEKENDAEDTVCESLSAAKLEDEETETVGDGETEEEKFDMTSAVHSSFLFALLKSDPSTFPIHASIFFRTIVTRAFSSLCYYGLFNYEETSNSLCNCNCNCNSQSNSQCNSQSNSQCNCACNSQGSSQCNCACNSESNSQSNCNCNCKGESESAWKLDLKRSKYKKLTKLLAELQKDGVISLQEMKGSTDPQITSVNRDCKVYKSAEDEFGRYKLRKTDTGGAKEGGDSVEYAPLSIRTYHSVSSTYAPFFGDLDNILDALTAKITGESDAERERKREREMEKYVVRMDKKRICVERKVCEKCLDAYLRKNSLIVTQGKSRGQISLSDVFLRKELFGKSHSPEETFPVKDVKERFFKHLKRVNVIQRENGEPYFVKGDLPKIYVKLENRMGGKKHVTHIGNLETYHISPTEVSQTCSHRFAASSSIQKSATGGGNNSGGLAGGSEVIVQGNVARDVVEVLQSVFRVPKAYIELIEKKKKGKK